MLLFQRCRTWSMSRTILVRVQRTFQPIVKSVQHEDWCSSWQAELDPPVERTVFPCWIG